MIGFAARFEFCDGGRNVKAYNVLAFFPQIVAHKAYQSARATASSMPLAVKRALTEICKRPDVRGRRITAVKITVSVLEEKSE